MALCRSWSTRGRWSASRWPSPSSWRSCATSRAPPPSTRRRPTRSSSPSTGSLRASPSVFLPPRARRLDWRRSWSRRHCHRSLVSLRAGKTTVFFEWFVTKILSHPGCASMVGSSSPATLWRTPISCLLFSRITSGWLHLSFDHQQSDHIDLENMINFWWIADRLRWLWRWSDMLICWVNCWRWFWQVQCHRCRGSDREVPKDVQSLPEGD